MTDGSSGGRPAPAESLRIGILGAARIAELSIVKPAAATGHRLYAVAARDESRAKEFADRHGVERVHACYADVLADPEVEAVYNPLANGLHGPWNQRSLDAGKHVLSEKPSAANAAEARLVRTAAQRAGTVFMEAFHYPYHPLFERVCELIDAGAVGELRHLEAVLRMPAPDKADPRWRLDLAGGSTMDLGCYSLSCLHLLGQRYAGGSPRVLSGRARERPGLDGVDECLFADLEFPSGVTGVAGSDMAASEWDFHLTVTGSTGEIHVPDFPRPHLDDSLVLRAADGERVEHLGRRSSYTYQLEAFAAAVRTGTPVITDAEFSVRSMELVDAAYAAAGLPPRRPTPV
ncbi:Gfo/Idh/MocA family protein [Segeticoccus rhizosphaerae]|uniref:Gfo/Idh/MocA family protein n=1 Tax=Segeticoccus rhizosphaerae TaxID=1104777 RepID=UPI00192E2FEB|nr:Gfo/Idh/MocA family oxidoreductase [Ornithinicoccus soli]